MSRILLEAHAHTSEVSRCSRLPAARLVESVHAAGYGALIVTDHYLPGERNTRQAREEFLTGFRAARDAAGQYGDMTVLPGMEIRFKGHDEDFLVYGLEEEDILNLPDDVCEAPAALHEFHEYCKAHGFLIYQAHPYRPGLFPANTPDIDGVEIFKGNPRHGSRNRMAALFASRHTGSAALPSSRIPSGLARSSEPFARRTSTGPAATSSPAAASHSSSSRCSTRAAISERIRMRTAPRFETSSILRVV